MEILIGTLLMVIIILLLYVIYILLYSMILGAPYAATRDIKMKIMLDMLRFKKGDNFVDLGSGDGRFVIEAARRGTEAHGYEMNPILVLISKRNIAKANLSDKAKIHWKSYWSVDLEKYNKIAVFGIKHIMPSLEKKLKKELRKESLVASNHFKFPNWKITEKKENLFLYKV